MEQKDPWLVTEFGKEQSYFNSISNTSTAVPGQGYVPYPSISPTQSNMMSQVTALSSNQNRTPQQDSQLNLLENNPDLQSAFSLLDSYTNQRRASEGLSPIPYPSQNLTPQESALISQESALPSGTGAKTTLIKNNQTLWNQAQQIMAQDTMYDVEKYGGVVQQGGTEPELNKDIYNAGQYDIAKPAVGTDASQYVVNPELAYSGGTLNGVKYGGSSGSGSGSSSSSSNPLVPMPKIKRPKKQQVKRPPKLRGFRAPHIKKATRVNVQANGRLNPTKVLHPTQVVKIR